MAKTAYSVPATSPKVNLNTNGTLDTRFDFGNIFQMALEDNLVLAGLFSPANQELADFARGRLVFEVPVFNENFTVQDYDIQTGADSQTFALDYEQYEVNQSKAINIQFDRPEVQLTQLPVLIEMMKRVMRVYLEWFEGDAYEALLEDASISPTLLSPTATAVQVYNAILDSHLWHEEKLANTADLVLVMSPKTVNLLKRAEDIAGGISWANSLNETAYSDIRINGVIGELDGVPIIKSQRFETNEAFMLVNTRNLHRVMALDPNWVIRETPNPNLINNAQLVGRFMAGHIISRRNSIRIVKYTP